MWSPWIVLLLVLSATKLENGDARKYFAATTCCHLLIVPASRILVGFDT
jgi:hypothetical protein